METKRLSHFITQIEELTNKPEKYLSVQKNEAETIKVLTKNLYNFTKEKEEKKNKTEEVLEKLVINNLDEEQIWQQVELQNNFICDKLVSDVAHLLAKKDTLKFPLKEMKKKKVLSSVNEKKENVEKLSEVKVLIRTKKKSPNIKSSIVDDKFFKLHEMEKYLEKVEKGEGSDGSDDTEIDYFEDDSDSSQDGEKTQLHYNDFFDQPEEETDQNSEWAGVEHKNENKKKKVKFLLNGDEDEDEDGGKDKEEDADEQESSEEGLYFDNLEEESGADDDDDDDDDDIDDEEEHSDLNKINDDEVDEEDKNDENFSENENETANRPSTFQARQERLKARIQKLEEEALSEKPWQLRGEVTGSNRPQNSLLEEYLEFDIATRPAPVITERSTLKLEDIILQRIKDKAWDDVVRKIKPVEGDIDYKKKLVLDQEKSKLSLAQIYEQEYLQQLDSKNEGVVEKPEIEAPEHQEIRIMMNKLFSKLDALSNFHFTPKQVAPEVKIISNLPAINMEEVAPVATSDATLLAPEEVKSKSKGDLIGKSERTATDKKRERRQKKLKQKLKYKKMEAKAKLQLEKPGKKDSQGQKVSQKFLQKLTRSRNVIQLEKSENGKYVKTSKAFFSKLQDEANGVISKKNLDLNGIKGNKKINAKKLKTR